MKDKSRKCAKCNASTARDSKLVLHRFPKPGPCNMQRVAAWIQFCYPEEDWKSEEFQKKVYVSHKMLCSKHFPRSAFVQDHLQRDKLHRYAVPSEVSTTSTHTSQAEISCQQPATLTVDNVTLTPALSEPGTSRAYTHTSQAEMSIQLVESGTNQQSETRTNQQPETRSNQQPATLIPDNVTQTLASPDYSLLEQPGTSRAYTQTSQAEMSIQLVESGTNQQSETRTSQQPETRSSQQPATLIPDDVTQTPASSDYSLLEQLEQPGTSRASDSVVLIEHNYAQSLNLFGAKCPKKSDKEKRLLNKCRRNLRKICSLQKRIKKLKTQKILEALNDDDAVHELSTDLTTSFAVLLQGQLLNCKRKKRGRRWNLQQKIISLRLYKRSPACYRLLRRLFSLPSQTTLKNLLNKLPLKPGINNHIFEALKNIAGRNNPQDNEYSLLFDEMSIRKNLNYNPKYDQVDGFQDHGEEHGRDSQLASHALVFMILGIRKKIKQPVAYYLSGDHVTADRLMILIKQVLHACFEAGINIAATICDMDGVNRRALSQLGASVEEPYFIYKEHEIVALHDTPHLLKCFRNLFLKYNMKCSTNVECNGKRIADIAKWSHIQDFYELDNNNPFFVFAPALTKSHLAPNNRQKMKVKLAAQVLSHTVSAGMYAKITLGELPTEALATVDLIKKIDQLFDSLNADSPSLKRGKKFSRNVSDRSPHFEYFREMKIFFKNCQFIGANARAPSLDGWIQTMTGVERLWRNLKSKYSEMGSLSTRRLQQDALENCFGCIRSNCGSNSNPTVSQFVAAFKTGIISNLSAPSAAANCETDDSVILDNLNVFLTHNAKPSPSINVSNEADCCSFSTDDIDENMGEIQACAYVCGYVIKKIKTNCDTCLQSLTSSSDRACHLFTLFKEYNDQKRSLQYANIQMIQCVEKGARITNDYLNKNAHKTKIQEKVKELLEKNINFDFLEKCQEHKEENLRCIINSIFYICINRYCSIKNRLFAENAAQVSLKKKINILKHT